MRRALFIVARAPGRARDRLRRWRRCRRCAATGGGGEAAGADQGRRHLRPHRRHLGRRHHLLGRVARLRRLAQRQRRPREPQDRPGVPGLRLQGRSRRAALLAVRAGGRGRVHGLGHRRYRGAAQPGRRRQDAVRLGVVLARPGQSHGGAVQLPARHQLQRPARDRPRLDQGEPPGGQRPSRWSR